MPAPDCIRSSGAITKASLDLQSVARDWPESLRHAVG